MYKKRDRKSLFSLIFNSFSSKKAQVTIFIILGIVLLLAVVLVFTLKEEITKFKPEELITPTKGKVENFIITCMDKVGEEALFKVGLQAGYIEVPEEIVKDASMNLKVSPMNVVPYWAEGPNTHIPSLEEIKIRIDKYLEENVRNCLFEMQAFQSTYNLIEKTQPLADTKIGENGVIFNLKWNVEIRDKSGEVITEVINHVSESRIKLKQVYEMARRVVEKEMEVLKFEDITQDLISLEHPDLPVSGIELKCTKKTWELQKVKDTLLNMLRINIRELKIQGTEFVEFPEELTYYQNHYIWDIGEDYINPDVSVAFNFDERYPYTFAVTPLSGNKMKSSQMGGGEMLSFLCIQTWKFTYDLIYPVLVRVRDETTGYEFNTAFTVHLIKNTPYRGEAYARPSYIVEKATDEDYCKNLNVPLTVYTNELVENNYTGVYYTDPLEDVNLSFTCLRYRCEMGQSEYDFAAQGHVAGIITNFPYCVGGILRGVKEGYKEDWVRVVTSPSKEVELNLVPVFEFPLNKVKVVKHQHFEDGQDLSPAEPLGNEMALITLTYRKQGDTFDQPYHKVTQVISKQLNTDLFEQESFEFLAKADFTYDLEINLLSEEKFLGGYKGNWTVDWDQLESGNEIIFHVFANDNPSDEEMFGLMTGLTVKSKDVPVPEIITSQK